LLGIQSHIDLIQIAIKFNKQIVMNLLRVNQFGVIINAVTLQPAKLTDLSNCGLFNAHASFDLNNLKDEQNSKHQKDEDSQ